MLTQTDPDSSSSSVQAVTPRRIAIVGFGTVGRSVARILCSDLPLPLRLTHVCNRQIERKRVDWLPAEIVWTDRFEDVLESEVDIVVELIGGLSPAEEWVRRALEAGKSVVTANKQLIARSGVALDELARRRGVHLAFEASVAGGIPVLSGVQEGLAGDRLHGVSGILNGTCNYILTRMEAAGIGFAEALKEAQALGFAEADPTDDVDGYDARAKLAILARVGLQSHARPEDIAAVSISRIEAIDFVYAHRLNCTIRQVARAERQNRESDLFAAVQPALVPRTSPLASVRGGQNLVVTSGTFGGDTVFSGHGAGGDPTAVAVVSDLVAIARRRQEGGNWLPPAGAPVRVTSAFVAPHYVRFTVRDRPGIIAALARIFADQDINIDAIFQEPGPPKTALPFVITLEECDSDVLARALEAIEALDFHVQRPLSLPLLAPSETGAVRSGGR